MLQAMHSTMICYPKLEFFIKEYQTVDSVESVVQGNDMLLPLLKFAIEEFEALKFGAICAS
jgi:hypothetical protein